MIDIPLGMKTFHLHFLINLEWCAVPFSEKKSSVPERNLACIWRDSRLGFITFLLNLRHDVSSQRELWRSRTRYIQ